MARPREFNTTEALERAMQRFWAKGYRGTSLDDLTRAMGLSKSSLYETFGSKHELFLSAIDHYSETVAARRPAALMAGAAAPKAGIAAIFDYFIDDLLGQGETCGCFAHNCAVEVALHDTAAATRAAACLAHLEEAFHEALRSAQAAGEIPAQRDARALARYLTSSLHGLMVVAKANPHRAALEDVVGTVLSVLE